MLINNAAIFKNDHILNIDYDNFIRHQAINLYAPMKLTQKLLQVDASCCVINILYAWSLSNSEKFLSYTLSKNALYEFTKKSVGFSDNVRLNGVLIGPVMFKPNQSQDVFDALKETFPTNIDDIFNAINLLISNTDLNGKIVDCTNGNNIT